MKIVEIILPRIKDHHNRFILLQPFKEHFCTSLLHLEKRAGQAIAFNFWNPSGHYSLDLGIPMQRQVAKCLHLMNKEFYGKCAKGDFADRSKMGNKSCMRNEKIAGKNLIWTPEL